MTLIHAVWRDNGFDVYADTLVSGGEKESGGKIRLSSCYTKLLALPVKYRSRSNKQPRSFDLGMAVTGSVVVCNGIYGLLSSLLQDLRAEGVDGVKRPPLFDEIVELAVDVAQIVFEDAPSELRSCFGFVLLGFEQATGEARWTLIETEMIDGRWKVVAKDYPKVFEGARISEGSAKTAHMAHLRANQADTSPISARFYRYVMSRERSDIGEGITCMRVDRSGVRLVPFLMRTDDGNYSPKITGVDATRLLRAGAFYTCPRPRQLLVDDQMDVPVPEFIPLPDKPAP